MPPQTSQSNSIPPPPPGYTLDNAIPPPPAGYTLDSPSFTNQQFQHEIPKPTELSGASGELKKFAIGIPVGAAKSAAQTLFGTGQGPVDTSFAEAKTGVNPQQAQAGAQQFRKDIQLKGAGEHIGAAGEQAGEMALTGGPLRQGAETLLTRLPFLGKFMGPGARVASEAVNTASNAAVHGQDPNAAALAGGAGATAAEFLPFLRNMLKESAEKQYGKVMNPTTLRNKNITQRVVPELLKQNTITTEGGLLKKASGNVERLGQDIDTAVQSVPASVKPDTKGIIDSLEKYKQDFIVNGVPVNQNAVKAASDLQDMITQIGPNVSYQSLNRVRQILDHAVNRAGGYTGKTLAEGSIVDAQSEAANAIRKELARQSPDISKINAEFHLWKGVQDVMQATAERRTGQVGGLIHNTLPFLGAAAGLTHGGLSYSGAGEGALYALVLSGVDSAVRSGAWRTASAVIKNRIADAIAKGQMQEALKVLSRFGSSAMGQSINSRSSSQGSELQQQIQ